MTDHYPPMKRCSDCDQPFEEDTGNRLCPDCNREYDRLEGAMTDTAVWSDLAIPPGELLAEELEARGMTQRELAERTGRPEQKISEIINGKKAITQDTALEFEKVLGTPAHIWLNLESTYRLTLAKQRQRKRVFVNGVNDDPAAVSARRQKATERYERQMAARLSPYKRAEAAERERDAAIDLLRWLLDEVGGMHERFGGTTTGRAVVAEARALLAAIDGAPAHAESEA